MKVLYSWLIEMAGLDRSVGIEEAAEKLTMLGMEVEGIQRFGGHIEGLVSGKVVSKEAHPDSDHLSLCKVEAGDGELEIVCGAENVAPGQIVPVAKVGCVLPGGFKIKKAKIRGATSLGMICSKEELGLEDKSKGIWPLEAVVEVGLPSETFLGDEDAVYEVSLTSNRSDCLSLEGLARELAAAKGVARPVVAPVVEADPSIPAPDISIKDPDLCGRYSARLVKGVKIGPSPAWMVRRLEGCGIRSINNVVDATNFVLLELGHPLHAFDLSRLRGGKIIVRRAAEGEKMTTLDEVEHTLGSENLVIGDTDGAVALAGVMGGEDSEVHDATVDLLVESAWFDPVSVRRTAKKAGLNTEASLRFARTADWGVTVRALDRTVALILETAGGSAGPLTDNNPASFTEKEVCLRGDFMRMKLGFPIPMDEAAAILTSLEFKVIKKDDTAVTVKVPSFRSDVSLEIDLVEEVCRHYGYERMPATIFPVRVNDAVSAARDTLKDRVREVLIGSGLQEVINFNFVLAEDAALLDHEPEDHVAVLNPMSNDQKLLRRSLLPNLLKNIRTNAGFGEKNLALFELGQVFSGETPEIKEEARLAIALWGQGERGSWINQAGRPFDFYDLSGYLELLTQRLRLSRPPVLKKSSIVGFHPGRTARITAGKEELGMAGEIHPLVMKELDLSGKIYMMEVSVAGLRSLQAGIGRCSGVSRFPSLYRDLAFVVDGSLPAGELMGTIRGAAGFLKKMSLVSVYEGEQIGLGKKSLAFSFEFVNEKSTLSDDEADAIQNRIIKAVADKHDGVLR